MDFGVSNLLKAVIMISRYVFLYDLFKYKNIIFQIEWEKVKVDSSHPEFGERLKAAISAYNAKHI